MLFISSSRTSSSVRPDFFSPRERLAAHIGYVGLYQDFSEWDGLRDENSGMFSHNALVGANLNLPGWPVLRLDAMIPLHQESLAETGDTFEQGPMVIVSASSSF